MIEYEHTNTNKTRRKRQRTMRHYHDANVGPEDMKQYTVLRFFISTAPDETPEIFFIPMPREVRLKDDVADLKTIYAGDIERNAIPLSLVAIDQLYKELVNMKAQLVRRQAEFKGITAESGPPRPKIDDLIQRLK